MTKKEKNKRLRKLIRHWTRAEIIARHGHFDNLEFIDYALISRQKIDKIRTLLYGTSDLVELGLKWKLLKKKKSKRF